MLQEAAHTVRRSLGLEAGGKGGQDLGSDNEGISLGCGLHIERELGLSGHIVGEWKGPKGESQMTGFLL